MMPVALPTAPGWYIHDAGDTDLCIYRVTMQDYSDHPEANPIPLYFAAGQRYRADEIGGRWYGPLPLTALIAQP
jgi:hypothetical protein